MANNVIGPTRTQRDAFELLAKLGSLRLGNMTSSRGATIRHSVATALETAGLAVIPIDPAMNCRVVTRA